MRFLFLASVLLLLAPSARAQPLDPALVGTWTLEEALTPLPEGQAEHIEMKFEADGACRIIIVRERSGGGYEAETDTRQCAAEAGVIRDTQMDDVLLYRFEGTSLVVQEEEVVLRMTRALAVGLDPALVGTWTATERTVNGEPVLLDGAMRAVFHADGTGVQMQRREDAPFHYHTTGGFLLIGDPGEFDFAMRYAVTPEGLVLEAPDPNGVDRLLMRRGQ